MPRRIDAGEVLAALGGVLVFVSLFLAWFDDASGWESFEALDVFIAALALTAIWAAMSNLFSLPSALSPRALPVLGVVLLVVVAVQLIQPPPVFALDDDPVRETGAWLALAGAALVLLGGVLRAAHISVTVSVGGRDVRRRVPAVERRPTAGAPAAPSRSAAAPAPGAAGEGAVRVAHPASGAEDQATQPFSSLDQDAQAVAAPSEER